MKALVLTSLRLMLDFFGMRMTEEKDEVDQHFVRTEAYRERYRNFERRPHNWLRMTRIIKCLGALGLTEWQVPLCRFLLEEVKSGRLSHCMYSLRDYWIEVVLDEVERPVLREEANNLIRDVNERTYQRARAQGIKGPTARVPTAHPLDRLHNCGCVVV